MAGSGWVIEERSALDGSWRESPSSLRPFDDGFWERKGEGEERGGVGGVEVLPWVVGLRLE